MFEDSRTKVFVCNVTNANAATIAALPAQSGEFFLEPETAEEDVVATTPLRFVHRNTRSVLNFTVPFILSEVRNAAGIAYAARQEQVSYLGYNGTSGSMDAANSTYYGLQIVLNHTFGLLNNSPLTITVPYKSDASATQYEVANGLATAARAILKRHNSCIRVDVINSGALLNAMAANGAAAAAVVNGSSTITLSTDQSTTVSVGSLIRLGATGAGTAAVYKVLSIAAGGLIVVLDRPYEGATNAAYGETLIETVTEGNYGLQFTGVSVTDANFNPITDEPFVVSFTLQAGDFSTALVTNTTAPFIGTGTYQLVSALEAYSQFQNKTREVSAYPATIYNIDATAGTDYDCVSWEVYKQTFVDATTGIAPISKLRYVIFYHHADHAAELFDVVIPAAF